MICEKCKMRPATVHFTKIQNNHKTEYHLCEVCAQEEKELNLTFDPKFFFPNFLGSLFSPEIGFPRPEPRVVCQKCGFTRDQLGREGLLGCSDCYQVFGPDLDSILRRIHGNTRHAGKIPSRAGGALQQRRLLEDLKRALQEAVAKEEFERAAEIRDKIKALQEGSENAQD